MRLSGGLTSAPVLGILSCSAQLLSSREGFGTEREGTGPGDPSEPGCTLSGHDMTVRPHVLSPAEVLRTVLCSSGPGCYHLAGSWESLPIVVSSGVSRSAVGSAGQRALDTLYSEMRPPLPLAVATPGAGWLPQFPLTWGWYPSPIHLRFCLH